MPANNSYTGYLGWLTLTQINAVTGQPTGVVVPNVPTDPNYVAPIFDDVTCSPVVLPTVTPTPTLTLTPTPSPTLFGLGGLKFDGIFHNVNLTYDAAADPCVNLQSFTIYVDFIQTAGIKLIHNQKVSTDSYKGFYINTTGTVITAGFFNLNTPIANDTEGINFNLNTINNRVKLAIVLDTVANTWKLYVNGSLQLTETYVPLGLIPQAASTWQIGGYFKDQTLQQFQGYIFDFQYFNRALDDTEISNVAAGVTVTLDKLIDLKFNNNTGFAATESVSGNDGVLTNYTTIQTSLGPNNHWVNLDLTPKT